MPGEDEKEQPRMTLEEMKAALREDEQQKKLFENVEALGKKIDQVQKQQGLFCDPQSGMCFLTRAEFERFMNEQNKKIPHILDGAPDLTSFFQKVAEEEPGGRLYKILAERMPMRAKVGLVKFLCGEDQECRLALEKDPDIKIRDTGQRKPGLLGT